MNANEYSKTEMKAFDIFLNEGLDEAVEYLVDNHYQEQTAENLMHQMIDGSYDMAFGFRQ